MTENEKTPAFDATKNGDDSVKGKPFKFDNYISEMEERSAFFDLMKKFSDLATKVEEPAYLEKLKLLAAEFVKANGDLEEEGEAAFLHQTMKYRRDDLYKHGIYFYAAISALASMKHDFDDAQKIYEREKSLLYAIDDSDFTRENEQRLVRLLIRHKKKLLDAIFPGDDMPYSW